MSLRISRICFCRLLLAVGILFCAVGKGHGQRVYSDAQQSSDKQLALVLVLSEVAQQSRAIDADTSNHSTLSVNLALLGTLGTAEQNLQFMNVPKPSLHSPVIIKIGGGESILSLLGGFTVQRTNGGRTSLVNPAYSGNQLLNLLNLFGGNQIATAVIPPSGQAFDGVSLKIGGIVSLGLSANYYYAFYITPPKVQPLALCAEAAARIAISNVQSGYTYKVYNSEIGGIEIPEMTSTTDLIPVPASLSVGVHDLWLEAREGNLYPSARTKFTVTVYPKPGAPEIQVH